MSDLPPSSTPPASGPQAEQSRSPVQKPERLREAQLVAGFVAFWAWVMMIHYQGLLRSQELDVLPLLLWFFVPLAFVGLLAGPLKLKAFGRGFVYGILSMIVLSAGRFLYELARGS